MAKSLVIVESPAKSKTIGKFLGKDFTVAASMGHIVDLPRSKMGVDVKNNFAPEYKIIPERKKTLSQLKKEAKGKEHIYLAPDPDREGEAISWHLSRELGAAAKTKIHRVTFNEITKEAVLEAFKHPHSLDINLINAQQARRILDRIVGYSLSPLLWKKVSRGLSAGRVQSIAVKIIVEREREIEAFVSVEYWAIEAELKKKTGKPASPAGRENFPFIARLDKIDDNKIEVKTKEEADKLTAEISREAFIVAGVKDAKKKRNPLAPFTTSKLQQEAFNKLRFSVSKTMKIAQELYEGVDLGKSETVGLITYMRTDSVAVSKEAEREAKNYILKKFGDKYYPEKPNIYKAKKSAQEAHEAIRPAVPLHEPVQIKKFLNQDQYRLYELIWNRFISSQMSAALYDVVSVDIKAGKFLFKAVGTTVVFDGFTVLYPVKDEDEKEEKGRLPRLVAGERLDLIRLLPEQHFTKPPPRYSDASLVKALEEKGIGRPSTYAPTIYTIVARNYVGREKGYLYPTELGIVVTDLLLQYFPKILDEKFTAQMEEDLDKIEEGKMDWVKVLHVFYRPFSFELKMAHSYMKNVKKEVTPTDQVCELCGRPMVIKWGRRGKFLSCSGFPECKNAKTIGTGIKCPAPGCGGELVERRSRRGVFYGCSNYPKCTYIANKLPEDTGAINNA
ncbi:MAG: type I DNA topoisomerase [Candidatus Omnitrophica bacterium]|nr:type I DNA topoisomerase [Candidatus Omnitrophota bacterium]